jgi:hypothetical protein
MLPAIRENLEGLTDDEKKHYVEKDGKYRLDVGSVDGIGLEDVSGLKRTVETLRASETKIKGELDTLKAEFEGIDAAAAKTALEKMESVKNWDKDTKVKEAIEANKRDLVLQHNTKVKELEGKLTKMTGQLHEAVVTSKILEALQAEKGNVELLLPHVKNFVRMKEGTDGNFYPEVVGDNGDPRVGDTAGNPMTILQKVQEMKTQTSFAPAFDGTQSSGSGGSSGGSGKQTPGTKGSIQSDGSMIQTDDLESVASGETTVVVNQS